MGIKAVKLYFGVIIFFLTCFLLIVSIYMFLSIGTPPSKDIYIQLVTIIFPLILLSNFALIVFWIKTQKLIAILPLISIIINLNIIPSFIGINIITKTETPNSKQLKVATYNVNYFSYKRDINLPAIAKMIQDNNVDIIAMQEFQPNHYFNINEIIGEFGFLEHNIYRINKDKIGIALFSKYPIINHYILEFEHTGNAILIADINFMGDTIRVINTHLQTTGYYSTIYGGDGNILNSFKRNFTKREEQVDQLIAIINSSSYPIIVMGDLNETPHGYAHQSLLNAKLKDAFREAGIGLGGTFFRTMNLIRIDYIMYSPEFRALKYYKVQSKLSDHKPIFSLLEYQN